MTVVPCSALNLKITTRDDLKLAEQVLKVLPKPKLEGFSIRSRAMTCGADVRQISG